jgi:hypothetical protein
MHTHTHTHTRTHTHTHTHTQTHTHPPTHADAKEWRSLDSAGGGDGGAAADCSEATEGGAEAGAETCGGSTAHDEL